MSRLYTSPASNSSFSQCKLSGKSASSVPKSATAATAVAPAQYAQRPDRRPTAQEAWQDTLTAATFATVGALKADRYSPEREAAIIEGYTLGNSIPADIRRKLHRKHFHRMVKDMGL